MKNPLRRLPELAALLLAGAVSAAALTPTEWRYRQAFDVAAPGLVRVELPAATFDGAAAGLSDLRVLDASGRELAFVLDRPASRAARTIVPPSFAARLAPGATTLTLATGTAEPIGTVTLQTPAPFFLRAARIEVSADAATWTLLDQGVPLFRQWGAENLSLDLGGRTAAWIRVTVDDRRGPPLAFTGARLALAAGAAPTALAVDTRIAGRAEYAGETVLTLTAAGRHLPLAALVLDTPEPVFMRRVTVAVREPDGLVARERVVGSGTLYRVALEGAAPRAQLELDFSHVPATAELLVHIHNGDSPPLAVSGVQLKRAPVGLLFPAPAAGRYALVSGNPQADAPHYDLAALAGELREAPAVTVTPGNREETSGYRPREALAAATGGEIPLRGAPLDTAEWTRRKPVVLAGAGVQELELDPAALAGARGDGGDLRLMREGCQVPYLLERPGLLRTVPLVAAPAPDPQRPSVSRWEVALPQRGLPIARVVLGSPTRLFRREFRLYEKVPGADGREYERGLASGLWQRTPEPDAPATRTFELTGSPETGVLYLETDNGDNPPIALERIAAAYPVVRLVFKAGDTGGFALFYGNPRAAPPRYDLDLVAAELLTAARQPTHLGDESVRQPGLLQVALRGTRGGIVFWAALASVVVVLLVVVARLLPKLPGTQ